MATSNDLGKIGESIALKYLLANNYEILETNWRFKKAEIDIIARADNILVFIEVKSRSYTYYGEPENFVDQKKEALIIDAAQRYMDSIDYDWEIRFDIISIVCRKNQKEPKINHFIDAFFY